MEPHAIRWSGTKWRNQHQRGRLQLWSCHRSVGSARAPVGIETDLLKQNLADCGALRTVWVSRQRPIGQVRSSIVLCIRLNGNKSRISSIVPAPVELRPSVTFIRALLVAQ